jgi:hypothetical protein
MPNSGATKPLAGFVYNDRYLQHNPGLEGYWPNGEKYPFVEPVLHLSNYRLVMRTKHLLDLSGLSKHLMPIDAFPASVDDLTVYHTPAHVERIRAICEAGGGETGRGAPASPDSYEIALLAAGGGTAAVDAVVEGRVRRAFANVRPPGHHAMAEQAMGLLLQQCGHCRAPRARETRTDANLDRRLGCSPRQRHAGRVLRRSECALCLAAPGPTLSARIRRGRSSRRRCWTRLHCQPAAPWRKWRRDLSSRVRADHRADRSGVST